MTLRIKIAGGLLLLVMIPALQGAGIIRSIMKLAEEATVTAFQNGDLGSMVPTRVSSTTTASLPDAGLRKALASSPSLQKGVKAVSAGAGGHSARARQNEGSLSVFTQPASASVRIMNIKPRYHEGIELPFGRYDIELSAPGYRTKRLPLMLNSSQVGVDAVLQPIGSTSCNIDVLRFGGDNISRYGAQVRVEQDLPNITLYEAYSSLARVLEKESNVMHDIRTRIGERYAHLTAFQNSNLSRDDVEQGRKIDITDRALKLNYGLEQRPNDVVRLIFYLELPEFVIASESDVRYGFCQTVEAL